MGQGRGSSMSSVAIENYMSAFKQLEGKFIAPWFADNRKQALEKFQQDGFPTLRQENWKYTDVGPITQCDFKSAEKTNLTNEQIDNVRFKELDCLEMVFVNGHVSSKPQKLPDGIIIESLVSASEKHDELLQQHLGSYVDYTPGSFTALNTAFMNDGALIYIPDNAVLEKPICIFYLCTSSNQPFITHPHNLIVLGKNAQAIVIENYIGLDEADYLTNAVTEIDTGNGASLTHYKIQQESSKGFHIGSLNAQQDKDSQFESHSISLGGKLVRNDIISNLAQPGAEVTLNGLYMGRDRQHIDNHTLINHLEPHTRSQEYYRGVLDGYARGVFNGKVIVHKNAQKADAHQSNANLLLSDNAEADTKPELEIYADDVKCSHGATVGQLDETMLFYLRTRAINEDTARSLLTYAFAKDVINRIKFISIRERLEQLVIGHLPDANLIREFST
ncbi:MAG: Fe-S cluster assembly protein SufD [Gammaproteobacteria bacterium]